jgi:hypothetical protein
MRRVLAAASLLLAGCGPPDVPVSDTTQARLQEQAAKEANAQVGMPGITNFTEKKMVRMLYELRDKNISTFSYVMDINGGLWHLCDSIGFGLPYGVQFTNPEKIVGQQNSNYYYHGLLPQAEPNGLFMPPTAEGTWVMCAAPGGKIDPVYVEPRVITSPHRLRAKGDWQE